VGDLLGELLRLVSLDSGAIKPNDETGVGGFLIGS
jgi:hypothetical protein